MLELKLCSTHCVTRLSSKGHEVCAEMGCEGSSEPVLLPLWPQESQFLQGTPSPHRNKGQPHVVYGAFCICSPNKNCVLIPAPGKLIPGWDRQGGPRCVPCPPSPGALPQSAADPHFPGYSFTAELFAF